MTAVDLGADAPSLRALMQPRSVALIGASSKSGTVAARPLRFLRQAGWDGRVYPVNPTRDDVGGERCWRSLQDLPEVPDHAFILTNNDAAVEAAEQCARAGVPVATVLASGFQEAGTQGAERVERLRRITGPGRLRLLGPSSLGLADPRSGLLLTGNAAFAEADLPPGGIFAASHSGSVIGALVSRGKAVGAGFAGLVSVGNELDLTIGEICAASLDDEGVRGYVIFLESLSHADHLRAFGVAAAARGKPVIAYKLGRSEAGADLAISHTGAMSGEDDVAEAFLAQSGIARVETLYGLLEALPLLERVPLTQHVPARPSVGVVTTTGGGAAMVVDQLGIRNVDVVAPSDETLARFAEHGLDVSAGRIVDLTLAGTDPKTMSRALKVMLGAAEFDLVVAVVGSSARFNPDLAVEPLIAGTTAADPVAVFIVPDAPQAHGALATAGLPHFHTPESCADAVAAAFKRRWPTSSPIAPSSPVRDTCSLDEAAAYEVLAEHGIEHVAGIVLSADLPVPDRLPFDFPVVVKALSGALAHKMDAGGVVLDVGSTDELQAAVTTIRETVLVRSGVRLDRVLVQPMVLGLAELLVGFRRDAAVGPIVVLAAGGVLAELYRDRSIRLAPVDLGTAYEMLDEVRAVDALKGYRGMAAGDLGALASAVVAVSRLATHEPRIAEAEINPLIVTADGAVAVDALVVIDAGSTAAPDGTTLIARA